MVTKQNTGCYDSILIYQNQKNSESYIKALFFFIFLFPLALLSAERQTLLISSSSPFENMQKMTEEIVKEAGFKPQWILYPKERSYQAIINGEVALEVTRLGSTIEKMPNCLKIPVPILTEDYYPYSFRRDFIIKKTEDLKRPEKFLLVQQQYNLLKSETVT